MSTEYSLRGKINSSASLSGKAELVEIVKGKDGKSAYEIALMHGFEGTEAEWIASLEDMAKQYADESEQWADHAARARGVAIEAASKAEISQGKAKVSEDNAKQSETNAAASAAEATEMADLAGRAKTDSVQAAIIAQDYSAQAANSAQEAAAVKEYVDASVATAAKHAAAAKASEDVAKESGETATAKAAEIESRVSDAELAALNSAASANKSETFSKQSHQRYVDAANEANEAHSHMIGARDAMDEAINMYGMTSDLHTSVQAHADVVATQRNQSLEFMIAAETHARNASKSAQEAKEAAQKAGGVKTVNGKAPDENGNVQIETGGGGGSDPNAVKYTQQSLTEAQKAQARENIGVVGTGKDGEDGVSATHKWNGTTLSITSASGTSSADLKGDPGEPGKDYVLTQADKEEIVRAVIESIPVAEGGSF